MCVCVCVGRGMTVSVRDKGKRTAESLGLDYNARMSTGIPVNVIPRLKMACFELCPFCRCSTSPDSLKKSLNFASCCVRRNFIDFLKCCLQQILNSSGLLVNSANVIHKDISF